MGDNAANKQETQGAPEWIRVLPLGRVELVDRREPLMVDAGVVAALVHAFKVRGVDLVIDYEHQSLGGERAPAAGWIKDLEGRGDGLYARVEWTSQAMEYLANREYRYFSPVLRLDADSRRPMALMHLGLTNVPAIKHLPPLVARCGGDTATLARPAELVQAKEADGMTAWLKEFLGLPAEAEDAAVLAGASAALKELAQGLDLADAASAFQVRGAVLAQKAGGEGLRAAQEELLALKARQAQAEAAQAVTLAMKAGKVSPAQKEWALEYFRRDPEGFRTFAAHAPKLLPTGEALQWPEADDRPGDSLVPTEMAVCRLLKVSPEEYLKAKAQINKAQ